MEFNIVKELNGQFDPIVLIKADEKPEDALAPKAGRGGCVMSLVGQTIAKRKVTAFGRENITCGGVSAGLVGELDSRLMKIERFKPPFYL